MRLFQGRVGSGSIPASDHQRYDGQADIFLVYCPKTDKVYWLPVEGLGVQPYLRVDQPRDGRVRKDMRWAKDYELDVV